MLEQILVPDVGEAEDVEVIELLVAVGDVIDANTSLVVLESDKASMEIPSPCAGTIKSFSVSEGDKVSEGSLLAEIETIEKADAGKVTPGSVTAAVSITPVSVTPGFGNISTKENGNLERYSRTGCRRRTGDCCGRGAGPPGRPA